MPVRTCTKTRQTGRRRTKTAVRLKTNTSGKIHMFFTSSGSCILATVTIARSTFIGRLKRIGRDNSLRLDLPHDIILVPNQHIYRCERAEALLNEKQRHYTVPPERLAIYEVRRMQSWSPLICAVLLQSSQPSTRSLTQLS